jgi:hypothetical protein
MKASLQTMDPAVPLVLVKLASQEAYKEEGERLQHALGHFFNHMQKEGATAYSVRQGDASLLSLSVRPEGYVAHIVGMHNRPPTPEELALVTKLLADIGIETRYDPNSMC